MPFLRFKIDGNPAENSVHRSDAAEAPAPVCAKSALIEGDKGINVLGLDFSGGGLFLKFFSHKFTLIARVSLNQCVYLES